MSYDDWKCTEPFDPYDEADTCDHGVTFDEECEDCEEESQPSDEELYDRYCDQKLHEMRDEGVRR